METRLQASIKMVSLMDLDSISGRMEVCTLANSRMDRNMERENGKRFITPRIVTLTMESTLMIRRMGLECFNGKVAICSKVAIRMMKEMDMERCIGLMAVITKENGNKESNMVWEK